MDVEELELEAKATAAKHVSNMLQRPDQLEKVEQYKRRVVRKKVFHDKLLQQLYFKVIHSCLDLVV